MDWRFKLYNRDNIATIVDEPVGWDAIEIELKRDKDTHGIFADYQNNDFQFHGRDGLLIKAENDVYSIRGLMYLGIELKCSGQYEELYRGKLLFSKYDYVCGDECYAKISIETTSDVMDLLNKWDQKVDLQTEVAFDQSTVLPAYTNLPLTIALPSKGILIQNKAITNNDSVEEFNGGSSKLFNQGDPLQIEFGLPDSNLSEIGNFQINPTHTMDITSGGSGPWFFSHFPPGSAWGNGIWPLNLNPIINYTKGSPNYEQISNPVTFDIRLKGVLEVLQCYLGQTTIYLTRSPNVTPGNGEKEGDYEFLAQYVVNSLTAENIGGMAPPGTDLSFDFIFNSNVVINNDDRFYFFMAMSEYKTDIQIDNVEAGAKAMRLTIDTDSHILITNLSRTNPTPAKVFMVNEALSRISEAITNDRIRAFSEYFGRPDSQPYSHEDDGYGSLEAVTKGLFIRRQENRIPHKPFLMNLSLKDMWEGLEPIHHLGFGVEPDADRPGFNVLRVEHWKYFYNDTVIMSCTGISKITRRTIAQENYSAFQFGYAKWEAEEYNGLDEFLTKRNYRTLIDQVKNVLLKISNFIASPYAWEITRRKGANDSKDWRYDNDTFILCCKRDEDENIVVEQGNITNAENIIDPATFMNFRISPIRNAMRWIDKIFSGYKTPSSEDKIIFMDGDGNYHAKGEMANPDNKIENQPLSENQDISRALFLDPNVAMPLLSPDRVIYDYPMTLGEFVNTKANPYGKIYYASDCDEGYGWIDTITYKPEEGQATFNLIPKAE